MTGRILVALLVALGIAAPAASAPIGGRSAQALPAPAHTLVVVMENHGYSEVLGSGAHAPYLHRLAKRSASFTRSFAITHPSQPNYLDLFSGSNHGIRDDSCPHAFAKPNLGSELRDNGLGFAGYSEGLPHQGSLVCDAGRYARRHVPWTNFTNLPKSTNKAYAQFPDRYGRLPDVSFVVPNLCHDTHDCSVETGDRWLSKHIRPYVAWARAHSSVLILTWDEDDGSEANRVPTIIAGAGVVAGRYSERIDHYDVLRTIEDMYGLAHAGHARSATPITDIWGP